MDVQTDIVHDFLHGCLAPFIDAESGVSHASLIADRSPLGDNPRYYTGIKHPLNFQSYGLRGECTDMRYALMIIAVIGFVTGCGQKKQTPMPVLSPDAPRDQPVDANGHAEVQQYKAAIARYVQKARETYPAARQRYMDGLPKGYGFFAVTKLKDRAGTEEQVFVAITSIQGSRIRGQLASDILGVSGYKKGDTYAFEESELIDWLITHPDGTEEGNVVGKFLDEFQKGNGVKK